MTDDGLKPLPLTVMKVSGPPAGTASGLMDWITGPCCAYAAGKNELHRYEKRETAITRSLAGVIFYRPLLLPNNIRVWSMNASSATKMSARNEPALDARGQCRVYLDLTLSSQHDEDKGPRKINCADQ